MMTDPSRNVHLYGIDTRCDHRRNHRPNYGHIGVDPGPPNGAVKGRWRFRPPCTGAVGRVPTKPQGQCATHPDNTFLPPHA